MTLYSLARIVYYRIFRLSVRLRCFLADHVPRPEERDLPIPPALLRFKVSESPSAREFISIGYGCAERLARLISASGVNLKPGSRVLDFGCGCGRTVTWLMRRYREAEFHGVDVDLDAIRWCAEHLPHGRFTVTGKIPPLPYPAQQFDVVYCLSVFTHLTEELQDAWLAELNRVLRSDGLLIITVHGRKAAKILSAADLNALETTGFLHKTSTKLSGIMPEWYQTTWHSRAYIQNRLCRAYENVAYEEVEDGTQDFVVAQGKHTDTAPEKGVRAAHPAAPPDGLLPGDSRLCG